MAQHILNSLEELLLDMMMFFPKRGSNSLHCPHLTYTELRDAVFCAAVDWESSAAAALVRPALLSPDGATEDQSFFFLFFKVAMKVLKGFENPVVIGRSGETICARVGV